MSSGSHQLCRLIVAAALASVAVPAGAIAQTQLGDFNGDWHGVGTDRSSGKEPPQVTRCRTRVQADSHAMTTDTRCRGDAGLNKRVTASVKVEGGTFSGRLRQIANRGANLEAATSGDHTGSAATMRVWWPAWPVLAATVTLRLNDRDSFTMRVVDLWGDTLTDVTFRR